VSDASVGVVVAAGVASVCAAGVGALPLWFIREGSASLLGAANGVAAGVMVAISLGLAREGVSEGASATVLGIGLGAALILALRVLLPEPRGPARASRTAIPGAALVVVVMGAHSFAEGIAVGSSFAAEASLGLVTATAIAAHKTAEGFAIGLVLVPHGVRVSAAAASSMASALPQPLIAVPAFVFAEEFTSVLPVVLGLAAGAMTAVALAELLAEAMRRARVSTVALAAGSAFVVTAVIQGALT
jgi:ZIP family zinc transporter